MLSGTDLDHSLFIAAQRKLHATLIMCLDKGAKLGYTDATGKNAFHITAEENDTKTIQLLLKAGLEPTGLTTDSAPPIALAAWKKNWECVKLLAQKSTANDRGHALLFVAQHKRIAEAHILLEAGPIVQRYFNDTNNTALHFAALNQDADMIELLLQHKASPTAKNKAERTPVEIAIELGNQLCINCFLSPEEKYLADMQKFLDNYDPQSIWNFFKAPSDESWNFYCLIRQIHSSTAPAKERAEKIAARIKSFALSKEGEKSRALDVLKKYKLFTPETEKKNEAPSSIIVSNQWYVRKK